jgi:hypothetical protein
MTSPFDENAALNYNLFEGDFGDVGDRPLRDQIVTARKGKLPCHICDEAIVPKTRIRSLTMLWQSDGLMSYRVCEPCCIASALSWKDEGEAIQARYRLRFNG